MNGAGCRRKGHDFEREVARLLTAAVGPSKRGLSQPRGGTGEEPDVVLPEDVPLWVECKRGRKTNIRGALKQALLAADLITAQKPVAICKDDGEPATATMYLADWTALVMEWVELRRQAAHLAAATDEVVTQMEQRANGAA